MIQPIEAGARSIIQYTQSGSLMSATDVQLQIPDMKCEGCAERVTRVLERREGVRSADVSLDEKRATVMLASADVETGDLLAAVEQAGYSPEPA
jgi:copper chaperone CopZ